MKQRKVSKNTILISNGKFEDTSFRPVNQHLVNVNKGYQNNLLNFVNQLYEKYISLLICRNYVGPSASMGK